MWRLQKLWSLILSTPLSLLSTDMPWIVNLSVEMLVCQLNNVQKWYSPKLILSAQINFTWNTQSNLDVTATMVLMMQYLRQAQAKACTFSELQRLTQSHFFKLQELSRNNHTARTSRMLDLSQLLMNVSQLSNLMQNVQTVKTHSHGTQWTMGGALAAHLVPRMHSRKISIPEIKNPWSTSKTMTEPIQVLLFGTVKVILVIRRSSKKDGTILPNWELLETIEWLVLMFQRNSRLLFINITKVRVRSKPIMDHSLMLRYQNGKELFLESKLRRMRNTFHQTRDQHTVYTQTTVLTRTTRIFIKRNGLMELRAFRFVKMRVTLKLNVVVLNGMRVDGPDPNAIWCSLDGEPRKLLLEKLEICGKMLHAISEKTRRQHVRHIPHIITTVLTQMEKILNKPNGKQEKHLKKHVKLNVTITQNVMPMNGMRAGRARTRHAIWCWLDGVRTNPQQDQQTRDGMMLFVWSRMTALLKTVSNWLMPNSQATPLTMWEDQRMLLMMITNQLSILKTRRWDGGEPTSMMVPTRSHLSESWIDQMDGELDLEDLLLRLMVNCVEVSKRLPCKTFGIPLNVKHLSLVRPLRLNH